MILGIPMFSLVYYYIMDRRKWTLMATPIKTFKREADIEMYINILIDLVETREIPESRLNYFFLYFNKESN
jgi:hypothetical protein